MLKTDEYHPFFGVSGIFVQRKGGDPLISELSVKQQRRHAGFPGAIFLPFLWVAGYKEQRYSPLPGEPV